MANLKDIRTRIVSVKSTQQVTSAMKMVSAAKLRKAQDAIIQMRPYADKLSEVLSSVSSNLSSDIENKYAIIGSMTFKKGKYFKEGLNKIY